MHPLFINFYIWKTRLRLDEAADFCSFAASNSVAVTTVTSEIPFCKLYNLKKKQTLVECTFLFHGLLIILKLIRKRTYFATKDFGRNCLFLAARIIGLLYIAFKSLLELMAASITFKSAKQYLMLLLSSFIK